MNNVLLTFFRALASIQEKTVIMAAANIVVVLKDKYLLNWVNLDAKKINLK